MKVLLLSLTVLSSLVVVLHGRPQFPQLFNQAINALPPRLSNRLIQPSIDFKEETITCETEFPNGGDPNPCQDKDCDDVKCATWRNTCCCQGNNTCTQEACTKGAHCDTNCSIGNDICINAGVPGQFNVIQYFAISNLSECVSRCYANSACAGWVIKKSTNTCWLMKVYAGQTFASNGWISGPKSCGESLVKTATVCEWPGNGKNGELYLNCTYGGTIKITYALFGRENLKTCIPSGINTSGFNVSCSSPTALSKTKQLCDGKKSCIVTASDGTFGDPCVGTWKYLTVEYQCHGQGKTEDISDVTEAPLNGSTAFSQIPTFQTSTCPKLFMRKPGSFYGNPWNCNDCNNSQCSKWRNTCCCQMGTYHCPQTTCTSGAACEPRPSTDNYNDTIIPEEL